MTLEVRGKFLFLDGAKFYFKSVRIAGPQTDYAEIVDLGVNSVWLAEPTPQRLDYFAGHGLKAVAELGFDACLRMQFAGERRAFESWAAATERLIAEVHAHPALVAYDLGCPVPEPVRRWKGDRLLERELARAFAVVKGLDREKPITHTFSSREESRIVSCDFASVEVDEPSPSEFRAAMARLQTRAGRKPLVVRTVGVDSALLGEELQAHQAEQQVRMAFIAGCAGFVLGTWSDGASRQRRLGLVDVEGDRKASFAATAAALRESPFPPWLAYPKISVVICVYNGEQDIEECLEGVSRVDYPDVEVIVVDDGSTDRTLELAERQALAHGLRVVRQFPNRGLSAARNRGLDEASGEIVAYLDSDAFPDADWLRYLALGFLSTRHAILGGPNINPLDDVPISDCIDKAPGIPDVVMLEDELADHIPGCNLAGRRNFLLTIGGFDERYRGGGDDVTFCWKVTRFGASAGVSPGAMVWHHRRRTLVGYLRQQWAYGKGEAALARDWPGRFNALGHQVARRSRPRPDVRSASQTSEESAPVGGIYDGRSSPGASWLRFCFQILPSMPEWPMLTLLLAAMALPGLAWPVYRIFAGAAVVTALMWIASGLYAAWRSELRVRSPRSVAVLAGLHLVQPLSRMLGRWRGGLTPWRSRRDGASFSWPIWQCHRVPVEDGDRWCDDAGDFLWRAVEREGLAATRSRPGARWDWQIEGGAFAGVRTMLGNDGSSMAVRAWPYLGGLTWLLGAILLLGVAVGIAAQALVPVLLFTAGLSILAGRSIRQAGEAMASLQSLLHAAQMLQPSLWDRFQPPRNFFVDLAPPQDEARLRRERVGAEDQVALPGTDLQEQGGAAAVKAVSNDA
jgi:glycosyl transferase family 2